MNSVNGDHSDGLALSGIRVLDLTHQVAGPSARTNG